MHTQRCRTLPWYLAYRAVVPETHIPSLPNDTSAYRRNADNALLSCIGPGQCGVVLLTRETPGFASSLTWAHNMGPSRMDRIRTHFAACDPKVTAMLAAVSDLVAYQLELAAWPYKLTTRRPARPEDGGG